MYRKLALLLNLFIVTLSLNCSNRTNQNEIAFTPKSNLNKQLGRDILALKSKVEKYGDTCAFQELNNFSKSEDSIDMFYLTNLMVKKYGRKEFIFDLSEFYLLKAKSILFDMKLKQLYLDSSTYYLIKSFEFQDIRAIRKINDFTK